MPSVSPSLFGLNLLDVVLVGGLLLFAIGGYRAGLIARLAGWIGLGVGIVATFWTVPIVLSWWGPESPVIRFMIAIVVLSLTVSISSALVQRLGSGLAHAVHATPLQFLDHVGGFVAAVAMFGLVLWMLIPAAALVPGSVSSHVRTSYVVSTVRDVAPDPPDAIAALSSLIDTTRFPDVFDDLRPAPDTGPPPGDMPLAQQVLDNVVASTVRVNSSGCGRLYAGSGWAVGDGQVMTNAHVVAGADEITVRRPDGEVLDAELIRFDPDRDVAVLQVANLGQQPLPLLSAVTEGDGATVGYPGGQDEPRAAPVAIRDQRTTTGRDIYREGSVEREVVFLAAELRQGDSGSPVVDPDGQVVGTVFAVSPDRSTTAYALAPSELQSVLDGPTVSDSGRCL